MNATLCNPVDLDSASAIQIVQDQFATTPMIAVLPAPAYEQLDEEELYTSFEQAISDRVIAVNRQLSRISSQLVNSQPFRPAKLQKDRLGSTLLSHAWKQCILYMGLAVMFLLVGFDLMGLLMLYKH